MSCKYVGPSTHASRPRGSTEVERRNEERDSWSRMGEARCVLRKTDHGGIDGVRLMAERSSSCGLEEEGRVDISAEGGTEKGI